MAHLNVPETRYGPGAWITLFFASLLILGSMALVIYRLTLPTDGWSVLGGSPDGESNWVYLHNLVGSSSSLQENDTLLVVEGIVVRDTATNIPLPTPADWRVGREVDVTVLREGEEISFSIPVLRWTAGAWIRRNITSPAKFVAFLGTLVYTTVGFFTFFKRPELPSARTLLILCAAVLSTVINGSLPDGLSTQFNLPAFFLVSFYGYTIFGILLAPTVLAFTLHFPRTKRVIERRPVLGLIPVGLALVVAISVYPLDLPIVGWLGTMLMFVASLVSLVHARLTQHDAISRAQMSWAVCGFAAGLGLALLTFPPAFGWVDDPFWAEVLSAGINLGFPVIGVSLAIAVLRYRLWDIDLIIRRTLVYSALTALLALVYAGLIVLLQALFQLLTGQQSQLAIVISTLAIAVLFTPLRRRVQDFIDRRFYRNKYDAQVTLELFGERMRDEVDLDRLRDALLVAVEQTFQPEQMTLWVREIDGTSRSADTMKRPPVVIS